MSEQFHIPIAKHLEDKDNLHEGRDAELVPGQEHLAENMAEAIYQHAIEHEFEVLVFCISTKKRAQQTAELVEEKLSQKEHKFRIISTTENDLREIDQGTFVLPPDYKEGDEFAGLKMAGKIFSAETFNVEDSTQDNLNYHYGDPLLQTDGTYKYPELAEHFSSYGESYKEVMLRFYKQVIKLSENMDRFGDKVMPVIFTHGQPHQIFSNLSEVAEKIEKEGVTFEAGQLPRLCWDLYREKKKEKIPFGQIAFVSIEHICNPSVIALLRREIDFWEQH